MTIKWEEPPAHATIVGSGLHRGKYAELATALKENPSRWAKLPDYDGKPRTEKGAAATAQNIRRGKVKGFEVKRGQGKFETAVSGVEVWVRFVPASPDDEEEPEDEEDEARVAEAVAKSQRTKKVRAWAKTKGMTVPDRGRLPDGVWEAWRREHHEDGTPKPRAVR